MADKKAPPMSPADTVAYNEGKANAANNINARTEALKKPDTIKAVDQADKKVTPVQVDIVKSAEAMGSFRPNVLNDYQNIAYYLRLTMIHPQLLQDWNPAQGVVIAETATTSDMIISEANIKTVCNWDSKTQNVVATTGEMTIVEPLGVRFLDKLVRTANALRISNHTQAQYYLEITFKGTNPASGEEVFIPGLYYIWPIVFRKVDMDITERGGQYKIQFVHLEVSAQELVVENLKDIVNVSSSSVGEYFEGLQKALNEKEKQKVYVSKIVPNEYEFIVDPDIAKYKFANFNPGKIATTKSTQTSPEGKGKQVFREGSGILGLINVILAGTDEMQQLQRVERKGSGGGEKGLPSKVTPDEAADPYKFFRVQTYTQAIDFDSFTKDYAKKITYKIMAFVTPQVVTPADQDSQQGGDDAVNRETVKKRYEKLKVLNMLNKRYDYFYTGLNTEVRSFKITLNNAFFQPVPTNGTAFADTSQHGPKIKGNPEGERAAIDKSRKDWKDNAQKLKEVREGKGVYLFNNREKEEARLVQEQANNPVMKAKQEAATTLLGPIKKFGQNAPKADPHQLRISGLTYQDSQGVVDDNSVNAGWLLNRFLEDDTDKESTEGVESPFSNNRGSFGYIFNQLRASADLCAIDIEIVGDPFWFGTPNSILLEKLGGNAQMKNSTMTLADYNKGGNYFYLTVQTPSDYDPADGLMKFDQNQMISGLYLATTVEHTFKGTFVQKIHGVRDANIIASYLGVSKEAVEKQQKDSANAVNATKGAVQQSADTAGAKVPNAKK
jgi:hypothetical protein